MSELYGHSIATLATETTPREKTQRRITQEPPYKVILHNDDFTPMEYVVETLIKVIPRMSEKQALSIMIEAHTNGKAVAHKTHKELAELYAEQLNSKDLIATIEPD
ncbi:MAG: ATP-dependent Clp protease adaptor ClpS [Rubrobacteraceae bacterium]